MENKNVNENVSVRQKQEEREHWIKDNLFQTMEFDVNYPEYPRIYVPTESEEVSSYIQNALENGGLHRSFVEVEYRNDEKEIVFTFDLTKFVDESHVVCCLNIIQRLHLKYARKSNKKDSKPFDELSDVLIKYKYYLEQNIQHYQRKNYIPAYTETIIKEAYYRTLKEFSFSNEEQIDTEIAGEVAKKLILFFAGELNNTTKR